jgi:hypothetical protein
MASMLLLLSSMAAGEEGFTPLFDGKTLQGWEGNEKIFRAESEAIVAGSLKEKIAHNEFLCTKKEYGNFELRLKAKLVGDGKNAGIQFRSQRVPNHHEVSGYQCDMGDTPDRSIWGSLYDESRRNKFLVHGDKEQLAAKVKKGEFNDLVIRCEGKRIQIWVNDLLTVDYTETDDKIPAKGIIGLQIHGGPPAEASYKEIRIRELAP